MEAWELLDDTRWKILEALSGGPIKAIEIAEKVSTTTANISQHLKVLDAYGFVKKKKDASGKPGKPSTLYSLKGNISFIGLANPQMAGRQITESDDKYQSIILRTLLATTPPYTYYVLKHVLSDPDFLEIIDALCFLKAEKNKMEFFVMTENVDEFRKNYSNVPVSVEGVEKTLVCWSHSQQEIEEGLEAKDKHYRELVENSKIIYDPKDKFRRWKL